MLRKKGSVTIGGYVVIAIGAPPFGSADFNPGRIGALKPGRARCPTEQLGDHPCRPPFADLGGLAPEFAKYLSRVFA